MSICHACESQESKLVLPGKNGISCLRRCGSCQFVYLSTWENSVASAKELYDYYAHLTETDLVRRYSPQNRARQQGLLRDIARRTRGRCLLDVGCGEGQFLRTAQESGWDARGIDLSAAAIRLCRQRGLQACQTDFFDASFDSRRFDAILMSELLEHVPAPQRFLQRAGELLTDDGVLYLTTPNFGSLSRRLLGNAWPIVHPEHIGYFERATLRRMALNTGCLREIRIEANNVAPSTLVAWWRRGRASTQGMEPDRAAQRRFDQRLRERLHESSTLTATKMLANSVLSRAGLGDTLVAWLKKEPLS